MKENSRKEDIRTMENIIKSYIEADECGLSNNDFKCEIQALSNILSDYKRVLRENEIKTEKIENQKNEITILNDKQKDFNKLQNDLDIANAKIIELSKENEELKEKNESLELEEKRRIIGRYGEFEIHEVINKVLADDYIPMQKVKDKQKEKEWALESYDCTEADYKQSQAIGAWQVLQALIEESEEK